MFQIKSINQLDLLLHKNKKQTSKIQSSFIDSIQTRKPTELARWEAKIVQLRREEALQAEQQAQSPDAPRRSVQLSQKPAKPATALNAHKLQTIRSSNVLDEADPSLSSNSPRGSESQSQYVPSSSNLRRTERPAHAPYEEPPLISEISAEDEHREEEEEEDADSVNESLIAAQKLKIREYSMTLRAFEVTDDIKQLSKKTHKCLLCQKELRHIMLIMNPCGHSGCW